MDDLDEFEFRPDPTTDLGVSCPWASKNRCCYFFSVAIDKIHFKFVGNEDIHNISDKFEIRPDWTTDYGVNCPWTSKNYL